MICLFVFNYMVVLVASHNSEVVVEVKVDSGDVIVWLHAKLEQLFALIQDFVFLKVFGHVQNFAHAFPCVRSGMNIFVQVTVENLVEALLRGDFNNVVMLGERIYDSNLTCSPRQITDTVASLVFPPGDGEVWLPISIWFRRRHVQKATLRAHCLSVSSSWIDVGSGLRFSKLQKIWLKQR